jgi:hypothetical protein
MKWISDLMTLYERHVSKNKDALTFSFFFSFFMVQDHNVFQCKYKFFGGKHQGGDLFFVLPLVQSRDVILLDQLNEVVVVFWA